MCGLITGANCMKILGTIQLIASDSGGHHAYGTRLGWCIVGLIMICDSKGPISCQQAVMRDSSTSQVASLHFGIKAFIKDITLKKIFRMMYRNDISELALSGSKVSVEDRKFLKDDHFVVHLPFLD